MGIFELKCEECGKTINNVNVYVMEENKYQVSFDGKNYMWGTATPIEGGELYFDLECSICAKLIKRFAHAENLEAYLKNNSVEANRS